MNLGRSSEAQHNFFLYLLSGNLNFWGSVVYHRHLTPLWCLVEAGFSSVPHEKMVKIDVFKLSTRKILNYNSTRRCSLFPTKGLFQKIEIG